MLRGNTTTNTLHVTSFNTLRIWALPKFAGYKSEAFLAFSLLRLLT